MEENSYRQVPKAPKKPNNYPPEIKAEAVRMFAIARSGFDTREKTAQHVADLLGVGTSKSVMNWVRQAKTDAGKRAGTTTDDAAELRRLRREVAKLRRTNGILKAASAFFAAELDWPQP